MKDSDRKKIISMVEQRETYFHALSDAVWRTPELFFQEKQSSGTLIAALEELGFFVEKNVAGISTAFTGTYGSGHPVIAILGEFDALPQLSQEAACTEKKPVEEGAPGHGCGHNALGAASMAAAAAVKDYLEATGGQGTIRYYGCPAEEGGSGKSFMVAAGAFRDVDAAVTWHPDTKTCVMGVNQLAIQSVYFTFHGKSAHAAGCPDLGRSALDACELTNVGVNYLREHVVQEARIHYAYQDVGGPAPNVVQDHACLKYYIRAPKIGQMLDIARRVKQIARGAALMTETELDVRVEFGMCDLQPNDVIGKIMAEELAAAGGPVFDEEDRRLARAFREQYSRELIDNDIKDLANYMDTDKAEAYRDTLLMDTPLPYYRKYVAKAGSSDVGDVSYAVPTAWLNVAGCAFGTPFHSWYATAMSGSSIMHKAITCAAKTLALTAVRLMREPERIRQAKEEHEAVTGGVYTSPMSGETVRWNG
ncbi:MAG: amidohydrolase [Eubacteriales bacterium]|nr:amidohydrolase [Eubacteriales bacterium]